MAERLQQAQEVQKIIKKEGKLPKEDRSAMEQVLQGGEKFNGLTKKLQLGGAVVLAPFVPIASAGLLAGAFYDHAQEDYANQWSKDLEAKRNRQVAETYGANKVVVKGKVLDRNAYQSAKLAQESHSGSLLEKFGKKRNAEIVNVKALEARRAA